VASRQCRIEQRLSSVTCGRLNSRVAVVHPSRQSGAVIQKLELAAEAGRIGGAGLR